jgi:predicted RNase H-like nuclease (RuvC/YqgF family)
MPARESRPAKPMAVQEAIEEVNHIIETLRASLNDMEEVLETLELAERQKIADEQEIETLRRGLRQLHRPSDRGQHPPRH